MVISLVSASSAELRKCACAPSSALHQCPAQPQAKLLVMFHAGLCGLKGSERMHNSGEQEHK